MLCCPITASSFTPTEAIAQTVGYGFRGVPDNITEYRFNYNGKLNPDRPVPLAQVNSGLSLPSGKRAAGGVSILAARFLTAFTHLHKEGDEECKER